MPKASDSFKYTKNTFCVAMITEKKKRGFRKMFKFLQRFRDVRAYELGYSLRSNHSGKS